MWVTNVDPPGVINRRAHRPTFLATKLDSHSLNR